MIVAIGSVKQLAESQWLHTELSRLSQLLDQSRNHTEFMSMFTRYEKVGNALMECGVKYEYREAK